MVNFIPPTNGASLDIYFKAKNLNSVWKHSNVGTKSMQKQHQHEEPRSSGNEYTNSLVVKITIFFNNILKITLFLKSMLLPNFGIRWYLNFIYLFEYFDDV